VQQAVCGPTRASVLTSRYPDTTRVWDLYSYWRNVGGNFTTIPQLFKQHGYHTVGAGKIFHPGHSSGSRGTVPGHSGKGDDAPYSWSGPFFHAPNLQYWSGKTRRPGCAGCGNSWIAVTPDAEQQTPLPGAQIADHAIAQLANFSARGIGTQGASSSSSDATTQPFFLAVGFHKPHLPFVAPERFFQSYPLDEINLPEDQDPPTDMPPVAWSSWGELRAYLDIAALGNSGQPGDHLPANVTKALRRAYYAAVTWTDYNVGRVLAALDMYGYTNNTVVTFWGDHGWRRTRPCLCTCRAGPTTASCRQHQQSLWT
jgi:iduronate 2-sulfatase